MAKAKDDLTKNATKNKEDWDFQQGPESEEQNRSLGIDAVTRQQLLSEIENSQFNRGPSVPHRRRSLLPSQNTRPLDCRNSVKASWRRATGAV